MRVRVLGLALAASVPALASCSFGLFQTAHTEPPGKVSARVGMTAVTNELDDTGGRSRFTNVAFEPALRVGATPNIDLGLGSFLRSGVRADVKLNVVDPKARFAFAPRLGGGAQFSYDVLMFEEGLIASYRTPIYLEPYVGLTLANHWIRNYPRDAVLPTNTAHGNGSGDSVIQASFGCEIYTPNGVGYLLEYTRWVPVDDDPGDFYAFVPTNIFGLAVRFGARRQAQ